MCYFSYLFIVSTMHFENFDDNRHCGTIYKELSYGRHMPDKFISTRVYSIKES